VEVEHGGISPGILATAGTVIQVVVEVEDLVVLDWSWSGGSGIVIVEHQDQQDLQQAQVQTQLQHYPHQLVVVRLLHSQFLEI
jgi:hypothetical protein